MSLTALYGSLAHRTVTGVLRKKADYRGCRKVIGSPALSGKSKPDSVLLLTGRPRCAIELATAEQLVEINGLLDVINVSEKDLEKILSRASAGTLEELNKEQMNATIEWLKGKIK